MMKKFLIPQTDSFFVDSGGKVGFDCRQAINLGLKS